MRKVCFVILASLLILTGCSKKGEPESQETVQRFVPTQGQTEVLQNSETEQQTEAMQPSPDMYESKNYVDDTKSGSSMGDINFSNMPTFKSSKEETTTTVVETSTLAEYTTAAYQGGLIGGGDVTVPVAEEVTTAAQQVETYATSAASTEGEEEFQGTLLVVGGMEKNKSISQPTAKYSKGITPIYMNRESPVYKMQIDVPNVLGFDKDAYDNYIIDPALFRSYQSRLPKFSMYGYKIPYQYWYDADKKLLNPLPTEYITYTNLFYFADEPVKDPYAVEESPEETTTASTSTTSSSPNTSSTTSSSSNDLNIKANSDTNYKFMEHAQEVYARIKDAQRRTNYEDKLKTDSQLALDVAEYEFAKTVGLGNYYEGNVGPGIESADSAASRTYDFRDPTTGKSYEFTVAEMKELLGSGKWRELNK